jgi:hypothetical protein
MKPIMANPIAVAMAIFWNSENERNDLVIEKTRHTVIMVIVGQSQSWKPP